MTRKYESTGVRKQQIAAAAARIIVRHGSEHVTTRRIAGEVGISETTIYRHFKSKSELLSFLIEDIEGKLLAEIAVDGASGPYTVEALEKTVRAHLAHVVQRKGISFQIIAEIISLGSRKLSRQAYGVVNKYTGRIRDLLEEGRKAGVIRADIDLDAAAALFFGMTQGLVNTWALSQYSFDLEARYLPAWRIFRDSIIAGAQ